MTHFKVPSWASVALAILAGVLVYLNQTTFGLGEPWTTLVTAGLAALAGLGIAPLTGPGLRNAIHITYPAALAISSALSTAAVAVGTLNISHSVRSAIAGLLTAIGGMLVGPSGPAVHTAEPVVQPVTPVVPPKA